MPKKALIVDDSALVRKQLTELIQADGFEVDTAKNGQDAVEKATANNYDAITMDINMPVMDGLSATEIIMQENPTPILMISSLTTGDASATFDALDLGAVDYVGKPGTFNVGLNQNSDDILEKLHTIVKIPKRRLKAHSHKRINSMEASAGNNSTVQKEEAKSFILIGASTGGPSLIEDICKALPANFPHAICIVQHMPEKFTASFASRLNSLSQVEVIESKNGDIPMTGTVYIAKGGSHLHFTKKVSGKIVLKNGVSRVERFFVPSVDEMFDSALTVFESSQLLTILLTGIGDDGANGMVAIKQAGGYTIAENEESATVYGMPKEATLRGGTSEQMPFKRILQRIVSHK
jgi:two-component system, chemotaxis family, protein-glutamate methylesterase/glutaminase